MKWVLSLTAALAFSLWAMSPVYASDQLFEPLLGPGEELILQNGDTLARLEDGSLVVVSEDGTVKNTFPLEAKIYRDTDQNILIVSDGKKVVLGTYERHGGVVVPSTKSRSGLAEEMERSMRQKPKPFEHLDPLMDRWR
jgi:hypothetical protein